MAKLASRNIKTINQDPQVQDDGSRYTPVNERGERIYKGAGLALSEAVRLARTMLAPAGVARVESDGSLTPGSLARVGEKLAFAPVAVALAAVAA